MEGRLINCNLAEYSEAVCSIIENVQCLESEIKTLCEKSKIKVSRFANTGLKCLVEQKIIDNDKKELISEILQVRNSIIHEFYLTKGQCLLDYDGEDIKLDKDIMGSLIKLDKLIYEARDYIANKTDNENRPNFIDGTYEILK